MQNLAWYQYDKNLNSLVVTQINDQYLVPISLNNTTDKQAVDNKYSEYYTEHVGRHAMLLLIKLHLIFLFVISDLFKKNRKNM